MYRYDEFDHDFVQARVAQFTDQVERRLAGEITEDDLRGGENEVQKLTDKYIGKVDDAYKVKEAELMEV